MDTQTIDYLLGANPIKTAATKDFEEKKITKQDKDILDKVIEKESKQGWLVKSRSHDSDGNHGVVMVRRMGEPVQDQNYSSQTTLSNA